MSQSENSIVLEGLRGRDQNGSNGQKVGLDSVKRPVIGLALGGGAARGFAHIGILRSLLAHGIEPNVVVGTSIGAVVGGAYAAGRLDTLEEWARSLQPRNIFSYLDIRLNGSSLIGGAKLTARLEASLGQIRIEELPLKFASVATEVRTGHEIWLTHGRLVDALRASYALPGIFQPVFVGDRWLVDGALVNPVPVSAARAVGAEIVIAANHASERSTDHDMGLDPVRDQGAENADMREAARSAAAQSEPDHRPLDAVQSYLLAVRPVLVVASQTLKHGGIL
jgi:NTE family protein